jgi:chaperonin GroES
MKPIGNRVILSFIESEQKTATGIYIPDINGDKKKAQGIVEEVGQACEYPFKKGQHVFYSQHAGVPIDDCLIVKETDIIAVVE